MSNVLITGGAGFIGCNTAARFIERGSDVVVLDDLSRKGGGANLEWLKTFGNFTFIEGDVRDAAAMEHVFASRGPFDTVIHLAGQVAVTTSIERPREDFEINALGALNVLEGIRASNQRPLVIYASTNKVYGGMEDVATDEGETRYAYRDYPHGIPETMQLDFHSPYGCSKGASDQYVRDYHRIYGIPSVVMRQSCIYGYRQFGLEDQGWVAWFMIAAVQGKPITIYGDGKQVRDVLFIDDLVDAYVMAAEAPEKVAGEVFNVGGGPGCAMSVWAEFGPILEELLGEPIDVSRGDWRKGDQRVYISDIRKIEKTLGWNPKTDVKTGMEKLFRWISENEELFAD